MKEATPHVGTVPPRVGTAALGCPFEQPSARFKHAFQLLLATVREIFDESAYQRFLTHHHLNPNRASYALFLEDQETRKARQLKCC
jgi:hypothetical protein